ncbi:hypothetical protein J6590_059374 [Homalodisca vitripennis]|nr:hypothetical protein J6590_059374 [Homalodisca vitripennis]
MRRWSSRGEGQLLRFHRTKTNTKLYLPRSAQDKGCKSEYTPLNPGPNRSHLSRDALLPHTHTHYYQLQCYTALLHRAYQMWCNWRFCGVGMCVAVARRDPDALYQLQYYAAANNLVWLPVRMFVTTYNRRSSLLLCLNNQRLGVASSVIQYIRGLRGASMTSTYTNKRLQERSRRTRRLGGGLGERHTARRRNTRARTHLILLAFPAFSLLPPNSSIAVVVLAVLRAYPAQSPASDIPSCISRSENIVSRYAAPSFTHDYNRSVPVVIDINGDGQLSCISVNILMYSEWDCYHMN